MTKLTNIIKRELKSTRQLINMTLLASSYDMGSTDPQVRRLKRLNIIVLLLLVHLIMEEPMEVLLLTRYRPFIQIPIVIITIIAMVMLLIIMTTHLVIEE